MADDIFVKGKDKNALLADLKDTAPINTATFEQIRMGILVRCTEDMEKAIRNLQKSNAELSRMLLWLNVVLTVVTIIGVLFTGLGVFKILK